MENWIPEGVSPENFEKFSLLGPLCRLGVFPNEWVGFHMPWILLLLVEILRFFRSRELRRIISRIQIEGQEMMSIRHLPVSEERLKHCRSVEITLCQFY
jgi:hypothetical protein